MVFALREPDFVTASRVAQAINRISAWRRRARSIPAACRWRCRRSFRSSLPELMAQLETLPIETDVVARVVINERTGTVVVGGNVRLGPAAVAHGNLSVRITTRYQVSQPLPYSRGETVTVPEQHVDVEEGTAQLIALEGARRSRPWSRRSTRSARRRATSSPSCRRSRPPARSTPRSSFSRTSMSNLPIVESLRAQVSESRRAPWAGDRPRCAASRDAGAGARAGRAIRVDSPGSDAHEHARFDVRQRRGVERLWRGTSWRQSLPGIQHRAQPRGWHRTRAVADGVRSKLPRDSRPPGRRFRQPERRRSSMPRSTVRGLPRRSSVRLRRRPPMAGVAIQFPAPRSFTTGSISRCRSATMCRLRERAK